MCNVPNITLNLYYINVSTVPVVTCPPGVVSRRVSDEGVGGRTLVRDHDPSFFRQDLPPGVSISSGYKEGGKSVRNLVNSKRT